MMRDMFGTNRTHLRHLLANAGVMISTDTRVLEITDQGITIADKDGKRSTLEADTVVLAKGWESNRGLLETLKGKVLEIYAIGDCVEPRNVMNAIWEAFRAARLV